MNSLCQSLLTEENPFNSTEEIVEWMARRNREVTVEVNEVKTKWLSRQQISDRDLQSPEDTAATADEIRSGAGRDIVVVFVFQVFPLSLKSGSENAAGMMGAVDG